MTELCEDECECCGFKLPLPLEQYKDGDPLPCGCNGHVSVCSETFYIHIDDEPCRPGARCHD